MALPKFTIRDLLEAGVHFGHKSNRWNPKMAPFIFGKRNGIHIIDLTQTVPALYKALSVIKDVSSKGGKVLFVGSKPQAEGLVRETAERTGHYFMNSRWLGGTMTNWRTIASSIKRLKKLEKIFADESTKTLYTKKELLKLRVEHGKLYRTLGGVQDMGGLPDVLVVIDAVRENIAVAEAKKLGIPVVAILDTNADPQGISLPVPGNDDSTRAIRLYLDLASQAIQAGKSAQVVKKTTKTTGKKVTAKVSLSPKAKAEADKPEVKTEIKAKAKVETKAKAKVETKAKAKVETKAKAKVETKAKAKVETKGKAKVETKAKAKVETKGKAKIETKAKAKVETKAEVKEEASK
ncbi:MAG: 30S ribosomal protein S2 [Proteobacteria bacterium]|nr:30S ribosomal protein S2 [Pseudomonadota bacterium]